MSVRPEGFHAITPYLIVAGAAGAIDLYRKALDATEMHRMLLPGTDKVMHACIAIGDSMVFLSDEMPGKGKPAPAGIGQGSSFYVYVDDVDAQYRQALAAGMIEVSAPDDMFWGDRMAVLNDPYGHTWQLAAHVRDVTQEEMAAAMAEMAC